MSPAAEAMAPRASLEDVARWGLELAPEDPVTLEPVTRHSNFNHVYRVKSPRGIFYLKIAAEQPKRLPVTLPRDRIFSETEAVRVFGAHCGGHVVVPDVLFIDAEYFALATSDVGAGREVLIDVIDESYELLAEQAEPLGRALGAVHRATRGGPPLRPPREGEIVRRVIYDALLAPGAEAVIPESWPEIAALMMHHEECLVHADLWSKNLLVKPGEPIAVVDFEGAFLGDPAFDLGTLWAVALIPALQDRGLAPAARRFVASLLGAWLEESGAGAWGAAVAGRAFRYTAVFLAARGFGPFAYDLPAGARSRLTRLARRLSNGLPEGFVGPEGLARLMVGPLGAAGPIGSAGRAGIVSAR